MTAKRCEETFKNTLTLATGLLAFTSGRALQAAVAAGAACPSNRVNAARIVAVRAIGLLSCVEKGSMHPTRWQPHHQLTNVETQLRTHSTVGCLQPGPWAANKTSWQSGHASKSCPVDSKIRVVLAHGKSKLEKDTCRCTHSQWVQAWLY